MIAGALPASCLAAWAVVIAAFDLRQRRIPNLALVLVVAPAIVSLAAYGGGLIGVSLLQSLGGCVFAGALLVPGYLARQVGAGDVKLAAVMGLLLGLSNSLMMLLVSGVVIGLMALVARLRLGKLRSSDYRLPGGLALAIGFVWSLWTHFVRDGGG